MQAPTLLFLAAFVASVTAQPFAIMPEAYAPASTEPQQRRMSNYTGYLYTIGKSVPGDLTPNGNIRTNQANNNPFLSTLPGTGNGQTIVTMGPCAGNTPHTHPRGSEVSFLLFGNITFGLIEENPLSNMPILRNMTQYDTIHIPQGVLHFSHNPHCEPAAFLANFGHTDPGTQTMWNSMMRVPSYILNAATGLSEDTINQLKSLPLVTAPGTGGEECLRRCGLDFTAANNLTASAIQLDGAAFQLDPLAGTAAAAAPQAAPLVRAAAPAPGATATAGRRLQGLTK